MGHYLQNSITWTMLSEILEMGLQIPMCQQNRKCPIGKSSHSEHNFKIHTQLATTRMYTIIHSKTEINH